MIHKYSYIISLLTPLFIAAATSCQAQSASQRLNNLTSPLIASRPDSGSNQKASADPDPQITVTLIANSLDSRKQNPPSSPTSRFAASKTATPTNSFYIYLAQSGDSLPAVAHRFGVAPAEINSPDPLPTEGFLNPNQILLLPKRLQGVKSGIRLLPDSEVVYSPSAVDFSVEDYLKQTNGWLKSHREYLKSTGWTSAADIITRISLENSISPRLLLALLEYSCHCVLGQPDNNTQIDFLLGNTDFRRKGLYRQLGWAASRISAGYYGWRAGTLDEFTTSTGLVIQPAPDLNAGSVALQYFYAFYKDDRLFLQAQNTQTGLPAVYNRLFGNPWKRAASISPLFPAGLTQPGLILPFDPGRLWSFTSGPHTVWENEGAQAALDFAPATHESGCVQTNAWVVAVADGIVVRSEFGAVIQDLDDPNTAPADGLEQTGWVILYMHIENRDRVPTGTRLKTGDRIGHPSCEGGRATGTHLHIARKYNGEWMLAANAIPFNLEGWIAVAGEKPYDGALKRGDKLVIAHPYGSFETKIIRPTLTPTPSGE